MFIRKANQQTTFIEGQGQANASPKISMLKLVHDCVQGKLAYCMRLSYRETHVRNPLYVTVCKRNPHRGIKFSNKKKKFQGHQTLP